MNEKLKEIATGIGVLAVISLLCFLIYKQFQLSDQQYEIQTSLIEQKQLADGIIRAQSQYASNEDIEALAKNNNLNLKEIEKDLDKFRADIASINIVTVRSNGQQSTNIPSTGTGTVNPNPPLTCPDGSNCDPFGYQVKEQRLEVIEDFNASKIPFGSIGFSAWSNNPWSVDIKPRTYKITTVVGIDENQRQLFYNKFSIDIDGKSYNLPITSEVKQLYPSPSLSWNPRLYLGVESGITTSAKAELAPSVTVSLLSYGKFKSAPDFTFLHVGAGFLFAEQKPTLTFAPAMYNVGQHLPLMKNTLFGPMMHISTNQTIAFMLGLKVGL